MPHNETSGESAGSPWAGFLVVVGCSSILLNGIQAGYGWIDRRMERQARQTLEKDIQEIRAIQQKQAGKMQE